MLIILEGPDGAGKSTLAARLEVELRRRFATGDVVRLHAGAPKNHPLDEYLRPIASYRPKTGTHYILDRWHWGEDVYPTVRDRPTQLDEPARWTIEMFLRRLGAYVVYCEQYSDVYPLVYARRDELAQLDELPRVERLYRLVRERTLLPWCAYNPQSTLTNASRILDSASYHELIASELNAYTTYCGPRWPQFLLFGDSRIAPRRGDVLNKYDPAFVPFPSTSGHFLLEALADVEASRLFGVANACDVDDDPRELFIRLGRPPVVALGRNAQRRLSKLDVPIPHGAVPHPQYARRFHHSKRVEYGRLIGHALLTREDYIGWPASSTVDTAGTSTLRFSKTCAVADSVVRRATA